MAGLICSSFLLNAQSNEIPLEPSPTVPRIGLKYSLLSMISFPQGFQMGAEYFFSPHFSAYIEGGFLRNFLRGKSPQPYAESTISTKGFRLRQEVRYYLQPMKKDDEPITYFAIELFEKNQINTDRVWVERYGGMYQEMYDIDTRRVVFGVHLKTGLQLIKENGFTVDFSGGLGFKRLYQTDNYPKYPDITSSTLDDNLDFFPIVSNKPYFLPSVYLGLKIGYTF